MNGTREQLAKIIVARSYLHRDQPGDEPIRLASGKTSTFYFECQKTTRFAEAMPMIGRLVIERLVGTPQFVGGLASGADPIAQAVAHTSLETGRVIDSFSVRKERKPHGTMRWIEGCAEPGSDVLLVDDVITSGGSVIKAIERCAEENLRILQVVVLVDREQGGLQAIKDRLPGTPVEAIFTKSDLDEVAARERGRPFDSGVD